MALLWSCRELARSAAPWRKKELAWFAAPCLNTGAHSRVGYFLFLWGDR